MGTYALPVAAIAFLFSGFYKGLFWSPVDLTVVTAAATCIALLPYREQLSSLLKSSIVAMLAVLTAYLGLRLFPAFPSWGVRKLAETVLFGAPSIAAGYVIARHRLPQFMALLSWAAIPASIGVVVYSAFGNPYTFSWLGSGGYQLTGITFALSAIAAAVTNNPISFGLSVLGATVSGNLSGSLFVGPIILAIWVQRPVGWIRQASVAFVLLAFYTATVAPPLAFTRILLKGNGIIVAMSDVGLNRSPTASSSYLKQSAIGRAVIDAFQGANTAPDSNRPLLVSKTSDRLGIYASAWRQFTEKPLFGNGYGSISYIGYTYPHNIILEVLAEGGILGAGLLLAVLSLAPLRARAPYVLGYYALILLTSMVSGYWGGRLLFFGIGLVLGDTCRFTVWQTKQPWLICRW